MPKVVYTPKKGLVQSAGKGFEVGGLSILPAKTEMATYCIDFDGFNQGGTGSGLPGGNNTDGAFFVLSDKDATKVFYFTDSDEASPASAPSAKAVRNAGFTGTIDAFVSIETSSASTVNAVVGLIKTAVDAALTGTVTDNTDGTASYEAALPYAPKAQAHVGNMVTSSITVNNAGLGDHNSYTLNAYGVNFIDCDGLDQLATEDDYVLPDGSSIGQEVMIIMSLDAAETHNVTGTFAVSTAGEGGGATVGTSAQFTGLASHNASLMCVWDGTKWITKSGFKVAIA